MSPPCLTFAPAAKCPPLHAFDFIRTAILQAGVLRPGSEHFWHWLHNVKGAKFDRICVEVRENWTYDANFSNETNYTDSEMAFNVPGSLVET